MTERTSFEIYIAMNEDGDYGIGCDAGEAWEALGDNYVSRAVRTVCITCLMKPPTIETGVIEIGDDEGETETVEVKTKAE